MRITAKGSVRTLELGREHEEDEHHGERKRKQRGAAGPDLLKRQRRPLVPESVRQGLSGDLLQGVDGLPLGIAGDGRGIEFRRRIQVVARDPIRAGNVANRRERPERHGLAAPIAHPDLQDITGFSTIERVGLRGDPECPSEQIEIVDVGRTDIDLERAEHVGDVDAEHLRLGAIDIEIDLRRRVLEQGEHLRQTGCLRRLGDHRSRRFQQGLRAARGPIFHHHPDAAGVANARDGRRLNHQDQRFLKAGQSLEQLGRDAGGQLLGIPSTLVPRLQRQKDRT